MTDRSLPSRSARRSEGGSDPSTSSAPSASPWRLARREGSAQTLHDLNLPDGTIPELWDLQIPAPAIVVGSRQTLPQSGHDRAVAAGVEIAGRRSGGGAVLIEPQTAVWVDVLVPAGHPWFADDLTKAFMAIGERWADALGSLGHIGEVCAKGPDNDDEIARKVCFAGLGWGEVTIDGSKTVGLSQRRTRWGARVQCLADLSGAPAQIGRYVGVTPGEQAIIDRRCGRVIDSTDGAADRLRAAFLSSLSS